MTKLRASLLSLIMREILAQLELCSCVGLRLLGIVCFRSEFPIADPGDDC